jgi:hypothetical protein
MLTHAREVIKQGGLAGIGISYERNLSFHAPSFHSSSIMTKRASSILNERTDDPKSTAMGPLKGARNKTLTPVPLHNPISTKRGASAPGCISTTHAGV